MPRCAAYTWAGDTRLPLLIQLCEASRTLLTLPTLPALPGLWWYATQCAADPQKHALHRHLLTNYTRLDGDEDMVTMKGGLKSLRE